MGANWQKLGTVGNLGDSELGLRILTNDNQILIKVTMEQMKDRYFRAISNRLARLGNTPN